MMYVCLLRVICWSVCRSNHSLDAYAVA